MYARGGPAGDVLTQCPGPGAPRQYSAEFRSDAIALWRDSAGRRTFKDVAADLNVNPETLRTWVRDAGGRPVAAGASQDTEPRSNPERFTLLPDDLRHELPLRW
ncbi:transposase [Streptomyces sp. NPDC097727]|uniref:transposase n=1 Tax=Streptomyces sp. NPDC097727 TaxID=3366092 RepID=UPI0037F3BF7D